MSPSIAVTLSQLQHTPSGWIGYSPEINEWVPLPFTVEATQEEVEQRYRTTGSLSSYYRSEAAPTEWLRKRYRRCIVEGCDQHEKGT